MDTNTFSGFVDTFRLPIIMSLIGALIGHFAHNGVLQFPTIVIMYKKGNYLEGCKWYLKPIRVTYLCFHFFIFSLGIRFSEISTDRGIYIEMGFLGDLLIGIGTGILAKTTLSLVDTKNDFAVISASLLAGFAGLSYFKDKMKNELDQGYTELSIEEGPTNGNDLSSSLDKEIHTL